MKQPWMLPEMCNFLENISVLQFIFHGAECANMCLFYKHNEVTITLCFPCRQSPLIFQARDMPISILELSLLKTCFPCNEKSLILCFRKARQEAGQCSQVSLLPACRIIYSVEP